MRKFLVLLPLLWLFSLCGWGQIRTQGFLRLKADQARIEAALEEGLRTGRLSSNVRVWASLWYGQAKVPLTALDSARVASVLSRGYYLDRTYVKTYCLFLPRQDAFYLVRYVVGGLGIIFVQPAKGVYIPGPPLTRRQAYDRDRRSRQNRQRDRTQAGHLRYHLLEEGRLQL